ncbi:MAG: hypothetical protein ACI8O8_001108 [Oleiphilaceae bacterium]|jgi:hypothetical protein
MPEHTKLLKGIMMLLLYRVFGFLYLLSGLWCVFQLELVAGFVGYELLAEIGESEFFSVYGGLQVGIGMAMLMTSLKTEYLEAGVYFSAIFSSFLSFFRISSFVVYGFVESFVLILVLEVFIGAVLWGIWFKIKNE